MWSECVDMKCKAEGWEGHVTQSVSGSRKADLSQRWRAGGGRDANLGVRRDGTGLVGKRGGFANGAFLFAVARSRYRYFEVEL